MKINNMTGLPWSEERQKRLKESYPHGTVALSRGLHFPLEDGKKYLVRGGNHAVIMPRMTYSPDVVREICRVYGKENHFVGEKDLSEACSHHS